MVACRPRTLLLMEGSMTISGVVVGLTELRSSRIHFPSAPVAGICHHLRPVETGQSNPIWEVPFPLPPWSRARPRFLLVVPSLSCPHCLLTPPGGLREMSQQKRHQHPLETGKPSCRPGRAGKWLKGHCARDLAEMVLGEQRSTQRFLPPVKGGQAELGS